MQLFKKRDEDDVFAGGEKATPVDKRKRHMRARVFMAVSLVLITIIDWYITSHVLSSNTTLTFWVLSILLTIHIGWILVAIAILAP